MIIIEDVNNGYIITHISPESLKEVFVVADDNYDDYLETIKNTLLKVADLLGCKYDEYSDKNINITFNKKGRKLE